MKKVKLLCIGVALAAALGAVWYFASPSYAMKQLRDAALEGDEVGLEEKIDFARFRKSLKAEFEIQLIALYGMKDKAGQPIVDDIWLATLGPMIETSVTPEVLAGIASNGTFDVANKPRDIEAGLKLPEDGWKFERHGLSRFTARPANTDRQAAELIFEREGLGWVLVGLELPEPQER